MQRLVNPNILGLNPYVPGIFPKKIGIKNKLKRVIKLDSNENPFPLPKPVRDAIKKEIRFLNRYPDSESHDLMNAIARFHRIDPKNVIIGCGSVEIIKMIISAFLKPGEKVLTSKNTFMMYKTATLEHAGIQGIVEAEMDDQYRYDLDKMKQLINKNTKIIFIANPNNPTGTLITKSKILEFIKSVPENIFIVLDNAYQEYISDKTSYLDGIELARNQKNLIVLRTFSKIYALAGLRIGYGIAHEKTIYYLNQVRPPFNVTRLSQKAAEAALECQDFISTSFRSNQENRRLMFDQLLNLGLKVIPSETNFLLFFPQKNISELNRRLLDDGIIIRPLHAFGIPEGIRVTIGFEEENNIFIEKFQKILVDSR